MRIKLISGRKGSSTLLERHFELIRNLIQIYPNALWRKIHDKNGQVGYELKI